MFCTRSKDIKILDAVYNHFPKIIFSWVIIINMAAGQLSKAGAWLQKPGELQIINQFFLLSSDINDPKGANPDAPLKINSLQHNIYSELGLSKNYTVGSNLFYSYNTVDNHSSKPYQRQSFTGINFLELFVRKKILFKKGFIWSVQALVKLPGVYNRNVDLEQRIFGYNHGYDYEVRTQFGYSPDNSFMINIFGDGHFINCELGYRKRGAMPMHEIRADLTAGIKISANLTIVASYFKIVKYYTSDAYIFDNNPSRKLSWNRSDHNRFMLSLVHWIDPAKAVSIGLIKDVHGGVWGKGTDNINSQGLIFGFWIKI